MSDYKYSTYSLQSAKEEKLRLLGDISATRQGLVGLTSKISEVLNKAPGGIKATFSKEVKEAINWLKKTEPQVAEDANMKTDTDKLRTILSASNNLMGDGRKILGILIVSFTEKADALEKELVSKLSQLESTYYGGKPIIETWFGHEAIVDIDNSIKQANAFLRGRQLNDLGKIIDSADRLTNSRINKAQDMERKHQKRLYVLKALRQVCKEMGFAESEPRYEREDKRNRIVYEVDTLTQGPIKFFISLDIISANSAIPENRCLDEFDKVSQFLEEEFGVQTKFKIEGAGPDEKRLRKGEIDLPYGTSKRGHFNNRRAL